jgi:alkanesulfonate monooxygenase SsuD/methylene tetrahydromethanopterin reductase-like flavin-dependent oxidoreductase (luciferase family)
MTEMPYPDLPPVEELSSMRVTLPNSMFDPERGRELYKTYMDIYAACDDLGLDIFVNEHHQTATCLNSVAPLSLAALARETKRSRLLILGNTIANREDAVRVAEEMAFIDVLSGGRLECGFVRGVPFELSPSNVNPVDNKGRFWEATDLIIKAWTTHDGPFNWEGQFFQKRQVNIWPRPYQQPHPPIWVTTFSVSTAAEIAERRYVLGTIINGTKEAKKLFDAYRKRSVELGYSETPPEQFAYCGLVFVGESESEADEGVQHLRWYLANNKIAPQFMDPPGYSPVEARLASLRKSAKGETLPSFPPLADELNRASTRELVDSGRYFAGTPDAVVEQVKHFYREVGGFGHLLAMMHCGPMTYATTLKSMTLFSENVLPRLRKEFAMTESVPA